MHLTAPRAAVAAALAAGLLAASSASAAPVPSDTRLFLSAEGCGAEQQAGTLSTVLNPAAGSDGCGIIAGIPLEEVFFQLGEPQSVDYTTSTGDGVPAVLDESRNLTGVFATRSWTGDVGGAGQVTVDVTLSGRYLDAAGKTRSLTFGTDSGTVAATPTDLVVEVPFDVDIALPPAAKGRTFTGITLSAVVRGASLNATAQSYNGTSYLDLPTLVEPETADAAAE